MNQDGIKSRAMNKIVKARITALPRQLGDPLPEVWVMLSDGTEMMLFTYYPDEISFSESDFIGLTEDEARLLKFGPRPRLSPILTTGDPHPRGGNPRRLGT